MLLYGTNCVYSVYMLMSSALPCLTLPPTPTVPLQQSRRRTNSPPVFRCDYNVYSTFQSHEPEFDYLKSLEIEEKINQISWVKPAGSSLFLLTTNGKLTHVLPLCYICNSSDCCGNQVSLPRPCLLLLVELALS